MKASDFAILISLGALWGMSALLNRIAAVDFNIWFILGARFFIGTCALLAYTARIGQLPSLRAKFGAYVVMGLVNAAIPIGLAAVASLLLPTSFASILFSPVPLFAAVIAAIWLREPLTVRRLAGILVGIFGVAILVGFPAFAFDSTALLGILAAFGACVCYGLASSWVKVALAGERPMQVTAGQLVTAGAFTIPVALANVPDHLPALSSVLVVFVFGLISTALGYVVFFSLLEKLGPARTQTVALMVPCFGVIWGALFRGEPVTLFVMLGLAVVLASVMIVTEFNPRMLLKRNIA